MPNKLSSKKDTIIIVVCIILLLGGCFWWFSRIEVPSDKEQLILNKLDSLNSVVKQQTTIRDSLKIVLDTNTVTIKEIHKTYEKNTHTILHQSNAADWKFLTDYLSRYTIDSTGLKKVESDSSSTQ